MLCKVCNKEVKARRNGFNPVLQGKCYKNSKTNEKYVICYVCLRTHKQQSQGDHHENRKNNLC